MKKFKNNERGLIKDVVLVLVGLVALKYFFDFDLIGKIEAPVERGLDWLVGLFG